MNVEEARATYGEDAEKVLVALDVLKGHVKVGKALNNPEVAHHYLQLTMAHREREQFRVLYMDVHNRIIEDTIEFMGTLAMAAVFPREIVKHAMRVNAHGVLLCHNHPGGDSTPSEPDITLTARMVQALSIVDVRVLDHVIVSSHNVYSFGEHGLMEGIDYAVHMNENHLKIETHRIAHAAGSFIEP